MATQLQQFYFLANTKNMDHLETCQYCKNVFPFEGDETITLQDGSILCVYCLDSAYEDPEEEEEKLEF